MRQELSHVQPGLRSLIHVLILFLSTHDTPENRGQKTALLFLYSGYLVECEGPAVIEIWLVDGVRVYVSNFLNHQYLERLHQDLERLGQSKLHHLVLVTLSQLRNVS